MVDAEEPPEDLADGEVEAEEWGAREGAPAVAEAVDGQFGVTPRGSIIPPISP
jgi:hypothetical protein